MSGARVVITGGPTREPVDAVRYLGNRSSGKTGVALARAAWLRGADVTLVTGPTALAAPRGVEVVPVETARRMRDAVLAVVEDADAAVFAAAVADYRPRRARPGKIKRAEAGDSVSVALAANPDIAAEAVARMKPGSVSVGFALETGDLVARAEKKLAAKGFDLIVANLVGPGRSRLRSRHESRDHSGARPGRARAAPDAQVRRRVERHGPGRGAAGRVRAGAIRMSGRRGRLAAYLDQRRRLGSRGSCRATSRRGAAGTAGGAAGDGSEGVPVASGRATGAVRSSPLRPRGAAEHGHGVYAVPSRRGPQERSLLRRQPQRAPHGGGRGPPESARTPAAFPSWARPASSST